MEKFDIYVDSAANLTEEMIESNSIGVISYTCQVDGENIECYKKGIPFVETAKKYYQAMREGSQVSTSLLNSQKVIDAVTPSLESGKDVMIITISSGLSGSYMQAKAAADELSQKYPDRKIVAVDSLNASLGEGLFAVQVAKLRDMGQSIESCAQYILDRQQNMHAEFTVSDLKYLRRGGRISATLAIAGTLLNIKPILKADVNGKISFAGTERGRKKALSRLAETFAETVINPENQTIAICHADCEEDALALAEQLKAKGAKDIVINYYDICTGSHVGPGTVALFYLGKERGKTSEEKATNPKGLPAKANIK
jgi:DegV family protein with EDD domain